MPQSGLSKTGLVHLWRHVLRSWDGAAQRLFNRRTLASRSRLEILQDAVDAVAEGATAVDAYSLMTRRFGMRWAGHPSQKAHHQTLSTYLEALAQSDELVTVAGGYRPTGLALKALEEANDQDRKHSANLRVQALLAALAMLGLITAAAQAGFVKLPTVVDWRSEEQKQADKNGCR